MDNAKRLRRALVTLAVCLVLAVLVGVWVPVLGTPLAIAGGAAVAIAVNI